MSQPYKIAIAGIGGVGGYYGGMLANTYNASNDIEVSFIARGNHLRAIKEKGLRLEKDSGNITTHPHHITYNPKELGEIDLLLFSCKAYDLQNFASLFSENITEHTLILPLLNGVDSTEILQELYPKAKVLYGCTYLFSKIIAEGVVKMTGDLNQLLFGNPAIDRKELERIAAIFKATGVNVHIHDDIKQKVWEKFSFISPMATATSALDTPVDGILNDERKKVVLNDLMQEIILLSKHEDLNLSADILDVNMGKLVKLPAGATSSLHNDFKNNRKTELETITGYVVKQAEKHGVDLPAYKEQYELLKGINVYM